MGHAALIGWLFGFALAGEVDLNAATAEEIAALPGIGPDTAAAVVAWRVRHGPFSRLDDLDAVPGIGPATLANLRGRVTVRADSPDATPADARIAVDVNHAPVAEIATMPGLSVRLAEAVVASRESDGLFPDCAALARVDGIGPATLAVLADRCEARATAR